MYEETNVRGFWLGIVCDVRLFGNKQYYYVQDKQFVEAQ